MEKWLNRLRNRCPLLWALLVVAGLILFVEWLAIVLVVLGISIGL